MPTVGKFTHALVCRVPASLQTQPTVDGTSLDSDRARQQQESLVKALRDLGVDVLELPPDEASPASVFTDHCAVAVNGIALMCRPGRGTRQTEVDSIRAVLKKELGLTVLDLDSDKVWLNASDVLFTGKEFFVGISKQTNTEGALAVAGTWPEYPCSPVKVEGKKNLKDLVSCAGYDVLSVGASQDARNIMRRIERDATFRYQTLSLPEDRAANCLYVNGTLIHLDETEAPDSAKVFQERVDYPKRNICVSEFRKTGFGLSSLCLMVRKSKNIRKL